MEKELILSELQWRKDKLSSLKESKDLILKDLKDIDSSIAEYQKQYLNYKLAYQKVCEHINVIGTPLTPAFIQHDRFCLDCGLQESLLYQEYCFKILKDFPLRKIENSLTYKEFDDIVAKNLTL